MQSAHPSGLTARRPHVWKRYEKGAEQKELERGPHVFSPVTRFTHVRGLDDIRD